MTATGLEAGDLGTERLGLGLCRAERGRCSLFGLLEVALRGLQQVLQLVDRSGERIVEPPASPLPDLHVLRQPLAPAGEGAAVDVLR